MAILQYYAGRVLQQFTVAVLVLALYVAVSLTFVTFKGAIEDVSALLLTIGEQVVEQPPRKPKQVVVPLDYDEPKAESRSYPLRL